MIYGSLKSWRRILFSTLFLVSIVGLWFVFKLNLIEFHDVYLLKYVRRSSEIKTNAFSDNPRLTTIATSLPTTVPYVYGEPGCPDNPRREDLHELFRAWTSACKEHNIHYTLAFGSLLGAMRNKDVIPWDHDIDINIHVKYFPILKRLSEERKFTKADGTIRLAIQPGAVMNIPEEKRTRHNCQGKVTSYMEDQCSFLEPMARLIRGSVFVDFFHFYEKGDLIEDPSENRLKQYNRSDFYPFRPCSFMGFNASCPNRPWEILRVYFKTDNFEPTKKCKNGIWVDNN